MLQNRTSITKRGKCYYKAWQLLQSRAVHSALYVNSEIYIYVDWIWKPTGLRNKQDMKTSDTFRDYSILFYGVIQLSNWSTTMFNMVTNHIFKKPDVCGFTVDDSTLSSNIIDKVVILYIIKHYKIGAILTILCIILLHYIYDYL